MLLHGIHPLPDGRRVRLRLPLAGDRAAAHELLRSLGVAADDLELRRALRCIPGRRAVVVATELHGLGQRLAGFAAVDLPHGSVTVLAAPKAADLLRAGLREQAETWSRRVA